MRRGGLRKINTCRKVTSQVNFFRHSAFLSISQIFLRHFLTELTYLGWTYWTLVQHGGSCCAASCCPPPLSPSASGGCCSSSSASPPPPHPPLHLEIQTTFVIYLICAALQRHNTENCYQIFQGKELRGLSPNFHIHVSVRDLYSLRIGLPILLQENIWTDPGSIYIR